MKDNRPKIAEFKDLLGTIPLIIISIILYFLPKIVSETIFDSLFPAITIVLISLLAMFCTYSITKHKEYIWFFYEKPKKILENSLEPGAHGIYNVVFLGFGAWITLHILLLSLSLSPETFSGFIPFIGEEFRNIIENSIISALHILRSVVSTERINLSLIEESGLGIIIFTLFLSSGGVIMYSLKLQRAKIKKQEALKSQININDQNTELKKERYPGSRSVIIFFYASKRRL